MSNRWTGDSPDGASPSGAVIQSCQSSPVQPSAWPQEWSRSRWPDRIAVSRLKKLRHVFGQTRDLIFPPLGMQGGFRLSTEPQLKFNVFTGNIDCEAVGKAELNKPGQVRGSAC